MGKYTEWISYKGKRILFLNAAGLREAEYIVAQEELKQELLKGKDNDALVLVDATKAEMTPKTTSKAREVAAATSEKGSRERPSAIVGLTGLQKSVAQLFSRNVHFGSSIEESKDWLVREHQKRHKR